MTLGKIQLRNLRISDYRFLDREKYAQRIMIKGKQMLLDWCPSLDPQLYSTENSDHLRQAIYSLFSKLSPGPGTIISYLPNPGFVSILQMKRPRRKEFN